MQHPIKTIPGTWYTITATAAATVTETLQGDTAQLATLTSSGTTTFRASTSQITVNTAGKFTVLPTKATCTPLPGAGGNTKTTNRITLAPNSNIEDNFDSYGFAWQTPRSGIIVGLELECRSDREAKPLNEPIFVKVWSGTEELLARSTNAQTHALGAVLHYSFYPFEISAGEELRVTYHTAEGMSTDTYQVGVLACQRALSLPGSENGGFLNSAGGYSNTAWVAKHRWIMDVERYALAEHEHEEYARAEDVLDVPIAADRTDTTAPSVSGVGTTALGFKAKASGQNSTAVGYDAKASGLVCSTALGDGSSASGSSATALGSGAKADASAATAAGRNARANAKQATALGCFTLVNSAASTALGYSTKVNDIGVTAIGNFEGTNAQYQTLLYLIGANSPLATTYEDGAACLGYVVKDTSGNILECGTRKLSELLTNNIAFAPASMDLEAPAPTPFLPTGITDPIEVPEEDMTQI